MGTINKENDLKEKLLNGTADADVALKLLAMLIDAPGYQYMKVTLKDKREIHGSLIYLDENRILLGNCEENYRGYEQYVRHYSETLIPLEITERVEMKKSHFDKWYNQL